MWAPCSGDQALKPAKGKPVCGGHRLPTDVLDEYAVPLGIPSCAGVEQGSAHRYLFIKVGATRGASAPKPPAACHCMPASTGTCWAGTMRLERHARCALPLLTAGTHPWETPRLFQPWERVAALRTPENPCAQVLTAEEAAAAPPSLRTACVPSSVPSGLQGLQLEHLLGKGPYGRTYLGAYKGAPVAVKV